MATTTKGRRAAHAKPARHQDEGAPARSPRGRKRSEASRDAILQAALTLLDEGGFAALSIEAIAARAGVGKQTIYRWWSSKAAVVLEALSARAQEDIPLRDTGSFEQDLRRFFSDTFAALRSGQGRVVRGLMAEAQLDPEFGRMFREQVIEARRATLRALLERGVKARALPARVDRELLMDLLYGPMWYRLLVEHAPLDDAFAAKLARSALRAAQEPNEPRGP